MRRARTALAVGWRCVAIAPLALWARRFVPAISHPMRRAAGSSRPRTTTVRASAHQFTLLLVLSLGIMGIITPFGTGPSPVYYGSGYIESADWWKLGALFGVVYFAVFLLITPGWMTVVGR